jgi:hypothetical protein
MKNWRVVVVAFLAAGFFGAGTAVAQIPQVERDALMALYNATDGDNWTVNTNWLGEVGTECTWHGVTCSGGHVWELDLPWNNLSGEIPPQIGDLSSLWRLVLYHNVLSGSIPPEVGNLSSLGWMHLAYNGLSGGIPPEIGNLSTLVGLRLYSNRLSGAIPPEVGDLSSLWEMDLGWNQLSGSIPPEIGNLSSLVNLFLRANQLSGSIPPELGNLASLRSLYLSSNQLSGNIPPELGNLASLSTLLLDFNQLSGSIPPQIGNLSSLGWLFLRANQLSGSIPPELGNLSSLEYLYLSSNQLSGSIPPELGNLSNVSALFLRYNALWTDDAALRAFLDSKDYQWDETQTIAPDGLAVASVHDRTAWLVWTPITYTGDTGGYEVFSEEVVPRAPTSGGYASTKTATTFPVTGLEPGRAFDFTVSTFTKPHADNQNTVVSELTPPVMASTSDLGCAEPAVESWNEWPRTLTVTSSHDTFEWSTGETTSSIVVNPSRPTYYWVRTTGPGSCDEATVPFVDTREIILYDGFESGDTSAWSNTAP